MTLVELAKQADKLYDEFLKEQEELLPQQLKTMNGGITEEEQQEILEWIHEHDFMDTDEYDMPADYNILPEEWLNNAKHWDEQAFFKHIYTTDEDGNYINMPREDI